MVYIWLLPFLFKTTVNHYISAIFKNCHCPYHPFYFINSLLFRNFVLLVKLVDLVIVSVETTAILRQLRLPGPAVKMAGAQLWPSTAWETVTALEVLKVVNAILFNMNLCSSYLKMYCTTYVTLCFINDLKMTKWVQWCEAM